MLYNGRLVTCGIDYFLTRSDIVSLIHGNQEVTPLSGFAGKLDAFIMF